MLLFWNIRGLNSSKKQFHLKNILKKFEGDIVCLLETHIKKENQDKVMSSLLPGWKCMDNYTQAELGRIWILCNNGINFSMHSCSSQAIHCHIYSMKLQSYFFLSVIYA